MFKWTIILDRLSPRLSTVNNSSSEAGVTWGPMGTQPRTRPVAGSADWGRLPATHWQTRTLVDTRKRWPSHIWLWLMGRCRRPAEVGVKLGQSISTECCQGLRVIRIGCWQGPRAVPLNSALTSLSTPSHKRERQKKFVHAECWVLGRPW